MHVIGHLLAHHGVAQGLIEIQSEDGIEPLVQNLSRWLRRSGLERLGIVVDANRALLSRWNSIRYALNHLGYDGIPTRPDALGTVAALTSQPTIGVWIMPDNTGAGVLENFVASLIRPNDTLWRRAQRSVNLIREADRRFPDQYRIKAQIHTWLAWQEEPGTPMGSAITKRYLDADAPAAQRLITWIRRLFEA